MGIVWKKGGDEIDCYGVLSLRFTCSVYSQWKSLHGG